VAVGVREGIGVSVAVGRTGAGVNVDKAMGEVVESGGAGFGAQAVIKTNRRNKMLEGYIRAFLKSPPKTALGAARLPESVKLPMVYSHCPSPVLVYYRLNDRKFIPAGYALWGCACVQTTFRYRRWCRQKNK